MQFFYFFQLTSLDDAVVVVDDLRLKFRCRGQQIIGYRRKLRQQVRAADYESLEQGDQKACVESRPLSKKLPKNTFTRKMTRFQK